MREKRAKRLAARKQTLRRMARELLNDTLRRLTHTAYREALGIVPAYKRGQSPEERATKRKLRRSSKPEGCGDAAAQAHASPAKNSKRGKAGVGSKREKGPVK